MSNFARSASVFDGLARASYYGAFKVNYILWIDGVCNADEFGEGRPAKYDGNVFNNFITSIKPDSVPFLLICLDVNEIREDFLVGYSILANFWRVVYL